MTTLLTALAIMTAYVVFVLASPAMTCRTCRGWGSKPRRRRRRTCHRCHGTGIRFRPGAPLIYRALSALRRGHTNGDLTPQPWLPNRRHPDLPGGHSDD